MTTLPGISSASDGDGYFLVTGKIGYPHVGETVEEVAGQLHAATQIRHRKTGMQDALKLLHQKLATWELSQAYRGEDERVIAMTLGADVLCGKFENAHQLSHGDQICAVVTRDGGVLRARSILRTSDHLMLFWGYSAGPAIAFRKSMKPALVITAVLWAMMVPLWLFLTQETPETGFPWFLASMLVILALFIFIPQWQSYLVHRDESADAAAVFATFGFPYPAYFDAHDGLTAFVDGDSRFGGINSELALARQKTKYRLPR